MKKQKVANFKIDNKNKYVTLKGAMNSKPKIKIYTESKLALYGEVKNVHLVNASRDKIIFISIS